jgi:hypothetical protein
MKLKRLSKRKQWMDENLGPGEFLKWWRESRKHKRTRTLKILDALKSLAGLVGLIKRP